jgi:adenosylhomocysteine nucleosidase
MSRVAIVAALEREVRPLVKGWRVSGKEYGGRRFKFYENGDSTAVCAGIGSEAARRAAEAVIALYGPDMIYSAGFAGALDPGLKVGDLIRPQRVVNAADGSSVQLNTGEGVLVSFGSVASPEQKAKLREAYAAQAVDMEAASVARAAEARGIRFGVVKAISDESEFALPAMERFVDPTGKFLDLKFVLFVAARPWMWAQVFCLARNTRRASRALCCEMEKTVAGVPVRNAVQP